MNNKKSFWGIDFLRVIAAFAVIILHISVPFINTPFSSSNWWAGHFFDSLTRFCVPIFVMVSGALLLNRDEDVILFLKKRFGRIVYPFLFWSLIYIFIKIDVNTSVKDLAMVSFKALKSGAEYHLWYIYMIIGLYLFVPIIRKWSIHAQKIDFKYFLVIWGIVNLIQMPLFNKFYTRIDLSYFSKYLGYLILGHYLFKFKPINNKLNYLLIILGFILTFVLTYNFTLKKGDFDGTFYGYLSINVILYSVGIFSLFMNKTSEIKPIENTVNFLSKYTYGIYLSHVFILSLITNYIIDIHSFSGWFTIPLVGLICFVVSFLLTFILSKIPVLGKYISGV